MTLQLRFPAERSSTSAGEGESEKARRHTTGTLIVMPSSIIISLCSYNVGSLTGCVHGAH